MKTVTLWPHQAYGITEADRMMSEGHGSICITSPTGGGKSRMMVEQIENALNRGQTVDLYTTRRLLTEQIIGILESHGIGFGVMAAGYEEYENTSQPVQICSTPTVNSRVFGRRKKHGDGLSETIQRKQWPLRTPDIAIFDEVHMQKSTTVQKISGELAEAGTVRIGYTATPLGVSHLYKTLVVAGVNSELRKCGALVPCHVFGPDEPDTSKIKRTKTGEFTYNDIKRSIWTTAIFGRVLEYQKRLNPDLRPGILFAPGVGESLWFAQQFERAGIRAAHIDGNDCYLDGTQYKASRNARQDIIEGVRDGSIKVVCNRFVMREGIDIPELYHCILATPIGSLLSYLQTVGRVLRNHKTLDSVVLQDHGGNWWRHGSPNIDRDWSQYFTMPVRIATDHRLERMREKKEPEPIICPSCGAVRNSGSQCYNCGHEHTKKSRMVLQRDGTLTEMTGDILKPRRVKMKENTQQLWNSMYHRMNRAKMTFRQARGLFFHENHYYPPHDLNLMPTRELDWFRKVGDVPKERLN